MFCFESNKDEVTDLQKYNFGKKLLDFVIISGLWRFGVSTHGRSCSQRGRKRGTFTRNKVWFSTFQIFFKIDCFINIIFLKWFGENFISLQKAIKQFGSSATISSKISQKRDTRAWTSKANDASAAWNGISSLLI